VFKIEFFVSHIVYFISSLSFTLHRVWSKLSIETLNFYDLSTTISIAITIQWDNRAVAIKIQIEYIFESRARLGKVFESECKQRMNERRSNGKFHMWQMTIEVADAAASASVGVAVAAAAAHLQRIFPPTKRLWMLLEKSC